MCARAHCEREHCVHVDAARAGEESSKLTSYLSYHHTRNTCRCACALTLAPVRAKECAAGLSVRSGAACATPLTYGVQFYKHEQCGVECGTDAAESVKSLACTTVNERSGAWLRQSTHLRMRTRCLSEQRSPRKWIWEESARHATEHVEYPLAGLMCAATSRAGATHCETPGGRRQDSMRQIPNILVTQVKPPEVAPTRPNQRLQAPVHCAHGPHSALQRPGYTHTNAKYNCG